MAYDTQISGTLVMVRPTCFGFNTQTAATNCYQNFSRQTDSPSIRAAAIAEFEGMVKTLRRNGITILTLESPTDLTPDAVFPNNWFSHHHDHTLVLYPMLAPNRRLERQPSQLITLLKKASINGIKTVDFSPLEHDGLILEGTGSLVLDRIHKVAFVTLSPRTTLEALHRWCLKMGYEPVVFHAYDRNDRVVYHTNIVMSVGDGFAVVTMEAIKDAKEKETLEKLFQRTGIQCIPISIPQMNSFCGNILHVKTKYGKAIVLSQTAHDAFTLKQRKQLLVYGELVPVSIPTIETVGGGSARCMLAEIFP